MWGGLGVIHGRVGWGWSWWGVGHAGVRWSGP